jgi:hypothetical protein
MKDRGVAGHDVAVELAKEQFEHAMTLVWRDSDTLEQDFRVCLLLSPGKEHGLSVSERKFRSSDVFIEVHEAARNHCSSGRFHEPTLF